ncbi:MAG: hypothetical protein IIT82_09045, partial [Selenomonas sp.]|nr:hypothetical protein [Selenomonas sp.]
MIKSQILVFLFHLWANVWRFEILFVSLWHNCKNLKIPSGYDEKTIHSGCHDDSRFGHVGPESHEP